MAHVEHCCCYLYVGALEIRGTTLSQQRRGAHMEESDQRLVCPLHPKPENLDGYSDSWDDGRDGILDCHCTHFEVVEYRLGRGSC